MTFGAQVRKNHGIAGESAPVAVAPAASFRRDLEGLRGLAILLVVAFHLDLPGLRGGFIGVDVFFVLSGYLITGLLARELETTGRIQVLAFYARRVRRLLPAAAVMLGGTVLLLSLFLSPAERAGFARSALAAAMYVSNIGFQRDSSDYFATNAAQNPFLHTWSLSVEEQFYLVWPLVLILTRALSRTRRWSALSLAALSAASFAVCLRMSAGDPQAVFFFASARAWEFGVGGLAALAPLALSSRLEKLAPFPRALGLAGIVGGAVVLRADMALPGVLSLLPVLGTAAVLLAGAGGADSVLACRPLLLLGRLSYSLYLWHWPVLVLAKAVRPELGLAGRLLLIALALTLAAASYALVENPIRHHRALASRPLLTLGLGAALTALTIGTASLARKRALEAAEAPRQRAIVEARWAPTSLYDSGCFLDRAGTELRPCVFGHAGADRTVVLFGDSHAAQWFNAFEAFANAHDWRLLVLTKMGCATVSADIKLWFTRPIPYPECTAWREAALARIVAERPALVVLGNSDSHVSGEQGQQRLGLERWREGMRATLERLDRAGLRTVILRDPPGPGIDVPTCLARLEAGTLGAGSCDVPRTRAVREDVFRATHEAAAGLSHVSTLDPTDWFCTEDTCPAVRNGTIAYGLPGHISHAMAATFAGLLARALLGGL
jgi:peptidoglycan/LPS O-acetylase OafA/YrhL